MTTTTPARRYSWRQGLALLGAAALLAATADGIGYATTGTSLVFGQAPGAAVERATADPLGKKTVRLKIGGANRVMDEQNFRKIQLPKGHYEISMNGLVQPDYDNATNAYLGCLVVDRRLFQNTEDPDYSKVFLIDSMNYSSTGESDWDSVVQSANVVSLSKTRTIVYGCSADSDANIVQETPLMIHVTKLDGIDSRSGSSFTPPQPREAHGKGFFKQLLR